VRRNRGGWDEAAAVTTESSPQKLSIHPSINGGGDCSNNYGNACGSDDGGNDDAGELEAFWRGLGVTSEFRLLGLVSLAQRRRALRDRCAVRARLGAIAEATRQPGLSGAAALVSRAPTLLGFDPRTLARPRWRPSSPTSWASTLPRWCAGSRRSSGETST